jgi:Fe2+ transport system protein FeoA
MGIESRENLETAVSLCEAARKIFSNKDTGYAGALVNEGNARQKLSEMGFDSKENLKIAVSLYGDAVKIYPTKSTDYARVLMNEGGARRRLAEIGLNSKENIEISKELYLESTLILEELEDGWTYSTTLLNLNSLLKNNFYKTGDKKFLEEWERNLGDIEEKIKNRDIRYKELLMARIHEIRANLLEFEGKSGINKASREYDKAYELSKDPFYKFMDEFCQARIDTISYCELVSNWKLEEKTGIFLDYYDYTVFECHLENALKSTINEEDELKLAVKKLTEIRDRTQIKTIKDRVSAYIYLLQALVDCFTEEAYTEAEKNVKEGCKIFSEYGDKQGQKMCEIFHNAVVKKRDPDAWQEIIRNREFSSNFYNLLCEYSDRKRADLELYRSGQLCRKMDTISEELDQVKEISIRTENKIDEIQCQLHLGFAEIKGQIEEGFNGTVAELRQIKGKIDNIEQDLDNLVQISNDVGGKEGECIREFASQMLELMKKGDYEALKRFSERIVQNSSSFEEIIEASKIPEKEKAEAKSKLADLKKIPGILKEKVKSFSAGVTENVIANLISGEIVDGEAIKMVSLVSGEIIKLLIPVLSTAAFGVPIPSKVVEMLLEAMRDS